MYLLFLNKNKPDIPVYNNWRLEGWHNLNGKWDKEKKLLKNYFS